MCSHCISSVKIGVPGQHSSSQLLQNLSTALPHVVKNIRESWDNVQSIHIKTSSSASLPIWSCRLDEEEGGRWDGLTRVPVPDDMGEEVKKGKKRALESQEEPGKKRQKSDTAISTLQASRPDSPSTESTPPKRSKSILPVTSAKKLEGMKTRPASGSSTGSTKEPLEGKQKPTRPTAVDFFRSDDAGDRPSSKPPASKTPAPPKPAKSKQSPGSKDSPLMDPKSKGEKPFETKTILKSSKTVAGSTIADALPGKEKHVKFAARLPDSKTKRDKALGLAGKKVRSGGGRSASVKDGVLGNKVTVK